MPKTIPQRELRNQNAAIMAAVAAGETFIITRNGTPVAELRPIAPQRRRFVPKEVIAEAFRNVPHIDYKQFREDIDRVVDQSLVDAWRSR